jgi:AraC-like DNA-binding protein
MVVGSDASIRRRVMRVLLQSPASSLAEVARLSDIDRHSIENAFRLSGISFRDVRAEIRMRYLGRALRSSRPLKAIAAELGYSSLRSLNRFAAPKLGQNVAAFRKHR